VLSLLFLTAAMGGCGKAQDNQEPQTTAAVSTSTKAVPSSAPSVSSSTASSSAGKNTPKASTAPSVSAKPTPKLTDVSFTLSLDAGQEYAEYPIPIYLKETQTLHLSWIVVKGGSRFYMTFSLPSGKLIAIRANGSLAGLTPGQVLTDHLSKSGDIVFSPDNQDWQEGDYLFHPQIIKGDPSITIKLLYWIE
jgi:hypothetical protein